jgi:geranylgeranyl diphosphate synthase type I
MQSSDLFNQIRTDIEADLEHSLAPLLEGLAKPIGEMIKYHLGWNQSGAAGKRIRPALTCLCCAAVSGDWQIALPAASAIEWIHNFSLIHDDIQDESATRRGRETLWVRTGVAQAINTGDAVFSLARLTTQRLASAELDPHTILHAQELLDQACLDLTIGQHLDMDFETRTNVQIDEYMAMINGKTAALLYATCALGALLGRADQERCELFGDFGRNLGLAFQMHDDLLGIWGDPVRTGKPAGDDILTRKKTLPILYGIETSEEVRSLWAQDSAADVDVAGIIAALDNSNARQYVSEKAEQFTQIALSALSQARPLQPYAQELEQLTHQLLQRDT